MEKYESQISEWKKKHREVFMLTVEDKVGFLKRPDRKILGYASSMGTKDHIKFMEVIFNHCWLGGDEEIKTDDSLFLAAAQKLGDLMIVKEAELVKL